MYAELQNLRDMFLLFDKASENSEKSQKLSEPKVILQIVCFV